MNWRTCPPVRLTTLMASMTRAVPATLICHMRSTSRTPARCGSTTNARCTTERAPVCRSSCVSSRHDDSCPRFIAWNSIACEGSGGCRSTPTTRNSDNIVRSLVPRLPETPVTSTVAVGCVIALLGRIARLRRTTRTRTASRGRKGCSRWRPKIRVVQHWRGGFSNCFQLVLQLLLLQSLNDRVLHIAQRDLPGGHDLVEIGRSRVSIGLRNLACLQLKYAFLIHRQTTRAPGSHIDLGRRCCRDAGRLEGRLLELDRVFASHPALPNFLGRGGRLCFAGLWFVGSSRVTRDNDPLQRCFHVLGAVLVVLVLNLLFAGMGELFCVM